MLSSHRWFEINNEASNIDEKNAIQQFNI